MIQNSVEVMRTFFQIASFNSTHENIAKCRLKRGPHGCTIKLVIKCPIKDEVIVLNGGTKQPPKIGTIECAFVVVNRIKVLK